MRPSDVITLLTKTIPAGDPVLITGAPGIGKSQIVEQAARLSGADLLLSHPAVEDPTDNKGIPWGANGDIDFRPIGQMRKVLAATTRTAWFLDDFGQGAQAVQASYMQWLLARECGGHRLPDCVTIIAATNRRTDKAGVSGILEPVKSRFTTIVELEPNLDDWCEWAFGANIPAELIAFIRFRAELLCAFKPSADLTNCPLPRTWTHVARLLERGLPESVLSAAIAGAVGDGAAAEFGAFRRMYLALPNIDGILIDPMGGAVPSDPATLYAVVTALGMRATVKNISRIGRYATRLDESGHGEFAALLVRDCVRRDRAIMKTPDFVKIAAGPLGQLMSGANV